MDTSRPFPRGISIDRFLKSKIPEIKGPAVTRVDRTRRVRATCAAQIWLVSTRKDCLKRAGKPITRHRVCNVEGCFSRTKRLAHQSPVAGGVGGAVAYRNDTAADEKSWFSPTLTHKTVSAGETTGHPATVVMVIYRANGTIHGNPGPEHKTITTGGVVRAF